MDCIPVGGSTGLSVATVLVEAATHVLLDVLRLRRRHSPDVDAQPWVARYLRDGTLERSLTI